MSAVPKVTEEAFFPFDFHHYFFFMYLPKRQIGLWGFRVMAKKSLFTANRSNSKVEGFSGQVPETKLD